MVADLTKATEHLTLKPVEQWSVAELLQDGARLGLMRLREFAMRVCDEDVAKASERPAWEQRLIIDASTTLAKLLANVQMEQMRAKRSEEQFGAFMATVDAFETQLYGSVKERKATAAAQAKKK